MKVISKCATEVTLLLASRTVQTYRATKGVANKIVGKLRHAKPALASAISNSPKQFHKNFSQIVHLSKLAAIVSLRVTKVGIMHTIDWMCLAITKVSSLGRSCFAKTWNFIKLGCQKSIDALKFLISVPIFISQSICKGILLVCSSIKNAILKIYGSILTAIRRLYQSIKKLVRNIVEVITYPFTTFYAFLKKFANNFKTTCIRYSTSVQSSTSNLQKLVKTQFSSANVFAVLQRPAVVLPLAFTIIAFVGLKVYDNQTSKVEYTRAALTVKREKDLLRQKQYILHGYENENVVSKRKVTKKDHALAKVSQNELTGYTDLQKAVDNFFHNHRVSEVMCDKNSCRMKVDDRILDGNCPLTADSAIFISEADNDHVVFADASGNRYVKSIDSLFDQ
ncbi:MAG: hypothetical protein LBB16_01400 [Puniceicoccales bacterium]|nr:hypothetical protein [Puniceicoccales bacterium]